MTNNQRELFYNRYRGWILIMRDCARDGHFDKAHDAQLRLQELWFLAKHTFNDKVLVDKLNTLNNAVDSIDGRGEPDGTTQETEE